MQHHLKGSLSMATRNAADWNTPGQRDFTDSKTHTMRKCNQ